MTSSSAKVREKSEYSAVDQEQIALVREAA